MKLFFSQLFSSLKFKIFLIAVVAAVVPAIVFSVCFNNIYKNECIETDSAMLLSRAEVLGRDIATSGNLNSKDNTEIEVRATELSQILYGRVILCDSSLTVIKDTHHIDEGRIYLWENVVKAAKGESSSYYDKNINMLTVTVPIKIKETVNGVDKESLLGVLVISKNMDYMTSSLNYIISLEVIFGILVALLAIIIGVVLGKKYSEPLVEATRQFKKGTAGSEITKLKVSGNSEIDELAEEFNAYINKMKAIDESRQEFVSNVSHELKTPLTSMKVLADSLIGMGEAPVELYQEFMTDIAAEIERENVVINDLLTLVRMDKSNATLSISTVNINELTETILKRLRPIAEKQSVELVLESYRPITAEVDEVKLSLAISNLIENGIKYNNEGGYVHVSLNADHQYFYIKVEDSGMGIPKESLEFIFERFYRVDKSHSREIGGTGLGLAITHMSIIMHHGEIKVDSELGEGTTFDVRIPLTHIVEKEAENEEENN